MPRNTRLVKAKTISRIPTILRSYDRKPPEVILNTTPRLWNAKRRIKTARGLDPKSFTEYHRNPDTFDWRSKVSPDVAAFVDANPGILHHNPELLRSPSSYFSRPHHVPLEQRKQIYLPEFSVKLIRTPKYGPQMAHFEVPLWFNKLDMRSYLENLYNVDVVHVRSAVLHGKLDHETPRRPGDHGRAFRHKSKKRMTVQLLEPFEWPAEPEDYTAWDRTEYHRSIRAQQHQSQRDSRDFVRSNPNPEHRHVIARQAMELLKGKSSWKPTWTQVPWDKRVMEGVVEGPAAGESSSGKTKMMHDVALPVRRKEGPANAAGR